MKFSLGLLLASLFTSSAWYNLIQYSDDVTVEDHVLTSVNDKSSDYIRIYAESDATAIGEHAFDGCGFKYLMVSNKVRQNAATFPDTLTTFEYTGPASDINFAIPDNVTVIEYACDEGFLNYWSEFIRPNIDGSICNVKKEHYVKMKSLYSNLNKYPHDLDKINSIKDGTGTIKDSVEYLDSYFGNANRSKMTEKEISQSVMITLILIIASFGMTSIGLFYFLKDKKVIE